MKGIILGGGLGSRLYPATSVTNKLLVPIFDKPLIYYPMATLMSAGIQDIMIISNARDRDRFEMLFGNGSKLGIKVTYGVQEVPTGIVSAFLIGEDFIAGEECALILGDNIFYYNRIEEDLTASFALAKEGYASIYGYKVNDPERFGIVELDESNNALSIEEKPKKPKSNYCVTGLYFYPNDVVEKAKLVKPSARGEYEITDLNNLYLEEKRLKVIKMHNESIWKDAGTFESMLESSSLIAQIEKEGTPVAALEYIAYSKGWISKEAYLEMAGSMSKNSYGQLLLKKVS